jgi:chloramphenicol-sensitive protein RarD
VVALVLVSYRLRWGWLGPVLRSRRTLLTFTASALLLSFNWFVYIWAVNAGYIVETSLGYFINPLVNVLLGFLFLGERLRIGQAAAIVIALAGVLDLTMQYGALPWIALLLAGSFGGYGLLRKTAVLGSLEGFTLETIVLFLPALAYLLYHEWLGRATFGHAGVGTSLLLACAGIVTAVPLLLFASGARRITTIQFLLGVLVYREALSLGRLIGFCIIWLALVIYTTESLLHTSGAARARAAASKP